MSTVVKDLGAVSAYAYAVEKGYTGTEEEFAKLMARYADVGQTAVDAAESALDSKTAAQNAATTATNKASEATTAAQTATTKAGEASQSASQAQTSAQTASTKASEASQSATTATEKATEATTAADTATTAKNDAVTAKNAAETAQGKAEDSADEIALSAAQIAQNTSDISELKSEISQLSEYGAENVCPVISGTYYPSHFTIVANGKGLYTVSGYGDVSGGWYRAELYDNASVFPTGIKAGDRICISCKSSQAENFATEVRIYVGAITPYIYYVKDNEFLLVDIPAEATGMLVGAAVMGGITFSSDTVIPMIYADTTKYEYDEEISNLKTSVSGVATSVESLKNDMPHDYVALSLNATTGIVNRWNQVNVVSEYAYLEYSVSEGEKYKVSGHYQGGNFPAYILLKDSTVKSFYNLDTAGSFTDIAVTIPSDVNKIIVNGRPASQSAIIKKYQNVPIKATAYDGVLVGKDENYLYQSINTAVQNNVGANIFIDCGTYETEVENLATDKILIGKDRDLCILEKHDGEYAKPPIEIAGGIIKNLTVKMINDTEASQYGYCVHSDNSATANKTLLISNCKFDNDLYRVIGMGVRGGETVIFENCEFVGHGETGGQAIYIHNSSGTKATVRFRNCYFKAVNECLILQGWGSDCAIDWEFIDCTCVSETYGVGIETVWTDYVSGSTHDTSRLHEFSGKFALLPTSHGNNISILNA